MCINRWDQLFHINYPLLILITQKLCRLPFLPLKPPEYSAPPFEAGIQNCTTASTSNPKCNIPQWCWFLYGPLLSRIRIWRRFLDMTISIILDVICHCKSIFSPHFTLLSTLRHYFLTPLFLLLSFSILYPASLRPWGIILVWGWFIHNKCVLDIFDDFGVDNSLSIDMFLYSINCGTVT